VAHTNITASEASRKFLGVVPPHMPFWGVQQLQREAYDTANFSNREARSPIGRTSLLQYLTGPARALIGL